MASLLYIRDNASGAILTRLNRDGRGRGDFPLEFFDVVGDGNNPNIQLNFKLKPQFTGIRIGLSEIELRPERQRQIEQLNLELANGQMVLDNFREREEMLATQSITAREQSNNNNLRNLLLLGGALVLL